MAFECVHCQTVIEDDRLRIPRSGAACPSCRKDPTAGWSPYPDDIAEEARQVAHEMHLRNASLDWGVEDAILFFVPDLIHEARHYLSIRLRGNAQRTHQYSVGANYVPPGDGFRVTLYDRLRAPLIHFGLSDRH